MNEDPLRTIDGSHPEKSGETRFSGETQFRIRLLLRHLELTGTSAIIEFAG